MFLKRNDSEINKQKEGVNVISESGCYTLSIKYCSMKKTTNGAIQLDFNFEGDDGVVTCYGHTVLNKDGSENFWKPIFDELLVIADLDGLSDPVDTEVTFGDKTVTLKVFEELSGIEVKVWLQKEITEWNGQVREALKIRKFYRPSDNASAKEILSNEGFGTRYKKDSKYFDSVKDKTTGTKPQETTSDTPANPFAK